MNDLNQLALQMCIRCGRMFNFLSRCTECFPKGEFVGHFKEPIKSMRDRVQDLKCNQKRHEDTAKSSGFEDIRKLHAGLARAVEREIIEFESAIKHLESAQGELSDQASI